MFVRYLEQVIALFIKIQQLNNLIFRHLNSFSNLLFLHKSSYIELVL